MQVHAVPNVSRTRKVFLTIAWDKLRIVVMFFFKFKLTCGTCAGLTVMSITIRILNILVIKYCKVLNGLEDDHQAGYNGFGTMMLVGFFVNNN